MGQSNLFTRQVGANDLRRLVDSRINVVLGSIYFSHFSYPWTNWAFLPKAGCQVRGIRVCLSVCVSMSCNAFGATLGLWLPGVVTLQYVSKSRTACARVARIGNIFPRALSSLFPNYSLARLSYFQLYCINVLPWVRKFRRTYLSLKLLSPVRISQMKYSV